MGIYFVSELDLASCEMGRSLKPSGRAVIGLGDPDAMSGFQDYGFHVRPIPQVVQAMESAGLTLAEHRQSGKGAGRFHMLVAARADVLYRFQPK
jgi:arsenite methyltransferase